MNDFESLLAILGKVPQGNINIDRGNMIIEVIDCEGHSILFLFDNDGNLHDWE